MPEIVDGLKTGWLNVDSYAGRRSYQVGLVGETRDKYRIRARVPTRLAGARRDLKPGEEALVPKWAVSCGVIELPWISEGEGLEA